MDIMAALGDCRQYNLHSHTQFCDGRAPMEEFALKARDMGFKHYGFSPHSPIPIPSSCNMLREDVPAYQQEVKRQQSLIPEVKFYTSMEIDFLGPDWGPAIQYFQNLNLDYAIGSVHFIPNQEGIYIDIDGRYDNFEKKMSQFFDKDIRYVVETFFSQSQMMVAAGGFEIIGHLDKIKHNGSLYHPGLEDEPWYQQLVNDLIDAVLARGYIIEINTKAWKEHHQLFPAQKHWKRLVQADAPIVINSDAHYPALIDASRSEAFAALDYIKTNHK